ncbi:hypothetical protein EV424DRAFT_1364780 [Suillus variegatus]|nr:hypothetical protein EV424DRAFT_1364780 [Suillus variegatus]
MVANTRGYPSSGGWHRTPTGSCMRWSDANHSILCNFIVSIWTVVDTPNNCIVWRSVRIIILPCVMWCGVATFGVFWIYNYSQAGSDFRSVFTSEIGHWVTAFLVFTLTTNLSTTGKRTSA